MVKKQSTQDGTFVFKSFNRGLWLVFIFKSPEKYIITVALFKKKKVYENRFKFLTVYFDVERTAILGTFSN